MTALTRRRATASFNDLLDWFDTWPQVTEWRHDGTHAVRVEDRMDEGRYVLRAELPGIDPEKDVTVSVTDRTLTIRAERQEEVRTEGRSEFQYGSFERFVTLPANALVDALSARYEDGILEVTVPLAEDAAGARVIPVSRKTEQGNGRTEQDSGPSE
jgi:HSP20 family molecular chaperone IbpA